MSGLFYFFKCSYTSYETFTQFAFPLEQCLYDPFTVAPISENWGLWNPITAAIASPLWIPIFSLIYFCPLSYLYPLITFYISIPIKTNLYSLSHVNSAGNFSSTSFTPLAHK